MQLIFIAVAAAMISRTGMMWFLLSCFANSNRRLRISIIICMIVQIVVNSITIVQIVVQCGPNPYYAVRLENIGSMEVQYWVLNRPIERSTFIICGIPSRLMARSSASRPMFRRLSDLSKEVRTWLLSHAFRSPEIRLQHNHRHVSCRNLSLWIMAILHSDPAT